MHIAALIALVASAVSAADVTVLGPDAATGTADAVIVDTALLAHTTQVFPLDQHGKIVGRDSVTEQIEKTLENLDLALGGPYFGRKQSATRIIKVNVYATDAGVVAKVKRVFAKRFSGPDKPAASFVVGALPHPDAKVAMDAVAALDEKSHVRGVRRTVRPALAGGHAGAHVAVLPPGAVLYVSGYAAEPAEIAQSARQSLEGLAEIIAQRGLTKDQIVSVKAFMHDPTASGATVVEEVRRFFAGRNAAPLVLVEWRDAKYPIEIEMVVAAGAVRNPSGGSVAYMNPAGIEPSAVYSRMTRLDPGKVIYTSGLYGNHTTTLDNEVRDLYRRLEKILKAAGSDLAHMAKATYYITDADTSKVLGDTRKRLYDPKRPPAASKGLVPSVGIEGKHITLDMIAGMSSPVLPPAAGPLFVWADLAKGETREFTLTNGRKVRVRLLKTSATRDRGPRHPVRDSSATVEIDGRRVTLGCGNYNLPMAVAGVQIDCAITSDYYEDTRHDFWGLEKGKDARLRIWPEGSPWMPPGRVIYPVRQHWFATNTQMSNEPTWIDGGEERGPGRVYYHYGLDIGVAELLTEAVAAVDGTVVALKGQWMPEHQDVEPPHGITPACVFILDDWGWYHRYEHVQKFNPALALGKRVAQGQVLGVGSKVGGTSWSHVHYDIRHRHPGGGHWVLQNGYPFLLESYERQYGADVVAVARPHQVALTGEPVTLDASRSWSRGRIVDYEWTLSDGRRATGPRVTRTYSKPGMYSEIVKVSESGGKIDHDFAVVLVFDRKDTRKAPHTMHASFWPTFGIKPGDPVTFKVRTFGTSDGEEVWDFADGTPPVTVRSLDGLVRQLGQDPSGYAATVHRFERAGRYIVRVERTNAAGVLSMNHLEVIVGED